MKLLGAEIDNERSFKKHVSTLGKKTQVTSKAIKS